MNAAAQHVGAFIASAENDVIERFYDFAGLGDMRREAITTFDLFGVASQFVNRGYEIGRCALPADGVGYHTRIVLLHHGREVTHQDISVTFDVADFVEV